jgi:hypothetical protein
MLLNGEKINSLILKLGKLMPKLKLLEYRF